MPLGKSAEALADTLKNSDGNVRAAKTGEHGWQGGAVTRVRKGYIFAAYSGGSLGDDLKVSLSRSDFIIQ
jgi:hypothetical protein